MLLTLKDFQMVQSFKNIWGKGGEQGPACRFEDVMIAEFIEM